MTQSSYMNSTTGRSVGDSELLLPAPAHAWGRTPSLPLLTTREVADYLQITPRRVGNLWKSGELKGFWLNPSGRRDLRFRLSDVEAFLETRQLPAGSAAG